MHPRHPTERTSREDHTPGDSSRETREKKLAGGVAHLEGRRGKARARLARASSTLMPRSGKHRHQQGLPQPSLVHPGQTFKIQRPFLVSSPRSTAAPSTDTTSVLPARN